MTTAGPILRTMRRRLSAVAVCALLLIAGCGGGSSPKVTASPAPSPTPLTAAQAKTLAAAGILTAADLPGYEVAPGEGESEADAKKLAACLGITHTPYLAVDNGRTFTKGDLEISSSVDVATSAVEAKAELAGYDSAKGVTCGKQQIAAFFTEEGLTVKTLNITRTPISVPGADGSFAYTLDVSATSPGGTIAARQGYQLGSLVGQVEIGLSVFSQGAPAVSLTEATALLVKAVERVKAAS